MADEVRMINGQEAGSSWEWMVAVGLWSLGWTFDYQVWYWGGRVFKGGQVVDFMVHTVPLPTPLYVYGDYWHGGPKYDEDVLARNTLYGLMGGQIRKPEVLLGEQMADQETTTASLFKIFGRGPYPSQVVA